MQVMVELLDPPAAVAYAQAMEGAKPNNKAARSRAGLASRTQTAIVLAAQDKVAAELTSRVGARELFRVHNALNGIAVAVSEDQLIAISKVAGIKRVIPIYPEYPQNSTSVPFIGAPNVWANNLTPPLTAPLAGGADGTGIRIGIIDTGIDYMHPDFGGPGAAAGDYNTEKTASATYTTTTANFPSAKVVGGVDLAGDAYIGSNSPVPDANPMDCNGHGSHVSGTAAGLGMNVDGTTFAGPYDANTSTYSGLLIGPGTAPKAKLYGIRVFGCFGSTGITTLGIDWAMDPNGDNDLSDHLDVINMSLGSSFGDVTNPSTIASDNAALAGVIVVTSAGNSGDTFFIAGAPGVASRAIATAASVDSGVPQPIIQVNSPGSIAGNYFGGAATFGPALTPVGITADAVIGLDPADGAGPSTTDACSALTNAAAIAGNICVVDRGTCGFIVKVKNCQNAGAIAAIVVDNAPGDPPPGLGGSDPTITIPSVRATLANGTSIKNTITGNPPVNITLRGPSGADTLASFSSRGPRRILGAPLILKPDIAAPGLNITSVETGVVCTTPTGPGGATCTGASDPSGVQTVTRTLTISGTSMACPHMTGIMALLREIHPDWTVEELKALAMNYAINDVTVFAGGGLPRYGPSRIGAGRVDPTRSAESNVIAFNAEDAGVVSVTFAAEVSAPITRTKKIRVLNKGTTSQTYDLAIDTVVDTPGVSFSLPGGSTVTVAAGTEAEFDVQMTADPTLMNHVKDPALAPTQGLLANFGDLPRSFLGEEGGYVTFSQSSTLKFRVPVYMAERPASSMAADDVIATGGSPTGFTGVQVHGTDLCTGTLLAGPTCTGSFPATEESLISPFELQVVSPLDATRAFDFNDIRYVGVAYRQAGATLDINNDLVMFGVASWGDWSTPNDVTYDICVDTNNDGVYDKLIWNANPSPFVAGSSPADTFVRIIRDLPTTGNSILGLGSDVNLVGPSIADTGLHLGNVMILAATPAQLGIASTAVTTIKYKVVTCPGNSTCASTTGANDHCSPASNAYYDQAAGPYTYNWAAQGLDFGGNFLDEDLNGNSFGVKWNTANMTANGSLGALFLHHQNGSGHRAEVAVLAGTPHDDLSVALGMAPPTPNVGDTVTITVTAANAGPDNATGVQVNVPLPASMTWVSDDSAAAYDPALGVWTIPGTLNSGASTAIHIQATVDSPGASPINATIGGASPLDPNAANDTASISVLAAAQADLQLDVTSSAPAVGSGDPVTFTYTLKNNGPDSAFNVATTVTLVPNVTITGNVPSSGTFNTGTNVWSIASLASGATATLDITVNAPSSDTLVASGTSTTTTADPNSLNNTDSITVEIGLSFFTLPPCRVLDTRPSNTFAASEVRSANVVTAGCGVPAGARAVSFNITAVNPSAAGELNVYATGATPPATSALSFAIMKTRANNGVSQIDGTGSLDVKNSSTGTVDIVIDVNGYFE